MSGDKSRNRITENLLCYISEFGLYSEDEEKLLNGVMIRVLEDAKIAGMSPVRRLACKISSEEKDEATTKAAALGMKRCMCANFRFLRGVEMTRLCGQLGRNVERNWGV